MACKTTIRLAALLAYLAVAVPAVAAPEYPAGSSSLMADTPSTPDAYVEYANFLAASGDDPGATIVLERGRVDAEPSAALLVALGKVYQREQKWNRAEAAAREALAVNPDYVDAHVLLGEIYFALDWQQSGLESYRRAIELEPEAVLPQVRLVGGLLDSGQVKQAEENCLQYIATNPEAAELWLALGRVFEKQGKHREAFTTYGQVLTIEPANVQAYARQGKLFCEFGQYGAAEEACRRALELDSDHSLAHAYLGIALSYQGKNDEARDHALIAESAGLDMASVWKRMDR